MTPVNKQGKGKGVKRKVSKKGTKSDKITEKKKLSEPKKSAVKVVAVRTRMYEVEDKDNLRVRNKEGLSFHIPDEDVFWIGEYDKKEVITKTQMVEKVMGHRGFGYLEFTKVNGENRCMYCLITGIHGNDVFLHDLEKEQVDSARRCKLENIQVLISDRVFYHRK